MTKKEFTQRVVNLDWSRCRNKFCCHEYPLDPPHHIKFRSQRGENKVTNGITLCRRCHDSVHGKGNLKINGERVTGRQYMIMILDALVGEKDYRWHDVHEYLKQREAV